MAVRKRNGTFYVYFYPFRQKKVGVKVDVVNKTEAKQVEVMLLKACRSGDYGALDPVCRETCFRMFQNQGWEIPLELTRIKAPLEELTLWKACGLFIKYPEIGTSRSRQRYERCIIRLVEHIGQDKPMKSIWVPDIKQYKAERLNSGASPATVNWETATLSKMFGVLIEMQLLDVNPVLLVKNLSTKSGEREVYLSLQDVQEIMRRVPAWFRPIVEAAYYTGMRRGEILNLTWKQVNLSSRIITLGPEDTKEGHWKRIPIHRDLIPVFQEAMKVRSLSTDKVFLIDGRPPHFESLKNPWRKAVKAMGLEPRPRFHDLRHTWKSNARRSGIDPEIRESIMGHWSRQRSVSERYGRISDQELLNAIDRMNFHEGETEIIVATNRVGGSSKKGNKLETNQGTKKNQGAVFHYNTLIFPENHGRDDWI